MLYPLAAILIIAWLLGLVSGYQMDGFIHILLVVAIVMILVRLIQGTKFYSFTSIFAQISKSKTI